MYGDGFLSIFQTIVFTLKNLAVTGEPDTAPKFVIPLRDMLITEGKNVSMEVKVRAKPTALIKWFKVRECMSFLRCRKTAQVCELT